MELVNMTEVLKKHLDELKYRYENSEAPTNKKDKEFFHFVKKETAPIYDLLEEWEKLALQVVKNREINTHPQQIASTKENMELLLMHSYYVDARRKRYMELDQSVNYIFDQVIKQMN